MLAAGRANDAIATIARAAAAGDADALYQQAIWLLTGSPLARDLPQARHALRQAVDRGHSEARLVEIALAANGTGAPPDWAASLSLLDGACAAADPDARRIRRLLAGMALADGGEPATSPAVEHLVADGSVRRATGMLTVEECAHVARSAADLLAPAVVVDPRTGRSMPHPIRTSDAAVISPLREDPVLRAINARIAAASDTAIGQGEALTILRYRPGQQFRLHSDALPGVRNQRQRTVLVYLNDNFTGGETIFPDHGLTITPRTGDAIIFDNLDGSGNPTPRARHAGAPVIQGTKWLATRWIRARAFDVWTGPEAA
ncbi:2OG-Fe(II) oxygenase [Sphingomonas sp. A2-49]|uniref:2OG-Fe(II) oxygenase n=1 Tax=Sphingomonas sp. A2-49 TaxID=1391375 RepID=UPI0021D3B5A0|nr:2OG-Fe(II) oxygenase [Sphingomonas sp. A2-49]MCU6454053.1 2OG-Fe(II) oxygenase [Sphingomonas sp. A2-49]